MSDHPQRICKRCLLREMPEAEQFANLYTYVKNLPQEDKVSDAVYEARLSVCRGCDRLLSGMCLLCGCYVELRAAMRVRSCPAVPPRWSRCEAP